MSIFRCEKCGCMDNTAVTHYWTRKEGSPALCSECDPEIRKWHGRFPKQSADGMVTAPDGFLISPEEDARAKQSQEAARRVDGVKHIGLEGVAKHYFEMGWNHGSIWHERQRRRMTLGEALARIPENFYLRCAVEKDSEDGETYLTATIMEEPPDGGWPSPDAYFGGKGYAGGEERIRAWKFDDVARVGVSGDPDEPEAFDRLVIEMIRSRWPEKS